MPELLERKQTKLGTFFQVLGQYMYCTLYKQVPWNGLKYVKIWTVDNIKTSSYWGCNRNVCIVCTWWRWCRIYQITVLFLYLYKLMQLRGDLGGFLMNGLRNISIIAQFFPQSMALCGIQQMLHVYWITWTTVLKFRWRNGVKE